MHFFVFVFFTGAAEPFPDNRIQQGVLLEGPPRARNGDCLGFGDYADVLVDRLRKPEAWPIGLGIFAQWGAGKASNPKELQDDMSGYPEIFFS